LVLLILEYEHAIREDAPLALTTEGDYDNTFFERVKEYEASKYQSKRSNRI